VELHGIWSDNSVYDDGGAIYNSYSSPTLSNCIIWGNQASEGQVYGGSTTASHCVIEGGFAGGTAIIDAGPLLLPLGDYGGPTETMPVAYGSPAIGQAFGSEAPATDQRG